MPAKRGDVRGGLNLAKPILDRMGLTQVECGRVPTVARLAFDSFLPMNIGRHLLWRNQQMERVPLPQVGVAVALNAEIFLVRDRLILGMDQARGRQYGREGEQGDRYRHGPRRQI